MSLTDLTYSTERPVVFSAGALLTGSMKPWSLGPFPEEFHASWRYPTAEGKAFHSFTYLHEVTDKAQPSLPTALAIRIVCHMLVDHIPEAGLREILESLGTAYEFHRLQPTQAVAPLPQRVSVPIKRGKTYERPSFQAVEE